MKAPETKRAKSDDFMLVFPLPPAGGRGQSFIRCLFLLTASTNKINAADQAVTDSRGWRLKTEKGIREINPRMVDGDG